MSKRITKQEFAALLGTHPKTVERYIGPDRLDLQTPEHRDFRAATGYNKNSMNGRVTFDDHFARIFAANATGNSDLRSSEPLIIEATDSYGHELVKIDQAAAIERTGADPGNISEAIAAAFLLPHKLLYSIREAQTLTGLSREQLRPFCVKIARKWKITPGNLKEAVHKIFDFHETTILTQVRKKSSIDKT